MLYGISWDRMHMLSHDVNQSRQRYIQTKRQVCLGTEWNSIDSGSSSILSRPLTVYRGKRVVLHHRVLRQRIQLQLSLWELK